MNLDRFVHHDETPISAACSVQTTGADDLGGQESLFQSLHPGDWLNMEFSDSKLAKSHAN